MSGKDLRIVFMGTPDYAKGSLEALVDNAFNVVGVFSQPDKPKGRGMQMAMSEVKEYALAMDLDDILGGITVGKQANIILTKEIPSIDFIPYAFTTPFIEKMYIAGEEMQEKRKLSGRKHLKI